MYKYRENKSSVKIPRRWKCFYLSNRIAAIALGPLFISLRICWICEEITNIRTMNAYACLCVSTQLRPRPLSPHPSRAFPSSFKFLHLSLSLSLSLSFALTIPVMYYLMRDARRNKFIAHRRVTSNGILNMLPIDRFGL